MSRDLATVADTMHREWTAQVADMVTDAAAWLAGRPRYPGDEMTPEQERAYWHAHPDVDAAFRVLEGLDEAPPNAHTTNTETKAPREE